MISIAIDIDGVLADSFKIYQEIADKEGVEDPFHTSYNGMFKVYTKRNILFGDVLFGQYREEIIKDVEPIEGSVEAYKKFVDNKNIIPYIVTSRYSDAIQETKKWLKQNGFTGYQDLLFLKDKLKAPCNVIVDDKPSTVRSYVENARMGMIYDAPYNKDLNVGKRVKNLNEAYTELLPYL